MNWLSVVVAMGMSACSFWLLSKLNSLSEKPLEHQSRREAPVVQEQTPEEETSPVLEIVETTLEEISEDLTTDVLDAATQDLAGIDMGMSKWLASLHDQNAGSQKRLVLPELKQAAPLEYPESAKRDGIRGHVLFRLLVSSEGAVEKIELVESSPAGVFEKVAEKFIRGSQFKPAQRGNEKLAMWIEQAVQFDFN